MEDPVGDSDHKEAAELAFANQEPNETSFPPAAAWSLLIWLNFVAFVQDFIVAWTWKLNEHCFISLTSQVKSPSEESVEKVPDHKKASKPAKSKLEPKETPIPLAEAGSVFVKVFW